MKFYVREFLSNKIVIIDIFAKNANYCLNLL